MNLNRVNEGYAWGECENELTPWADGRQRLCRNAVKFSVDGSTGVCASCGAAYECSGDTAKRCGHIEYETAGEDGWPDDDDPGYLVMEENHA